MSITIFHKKTIYRIVLWILLGLGLVVLIKLSPSLSKPEYIPGDDFALYWAGGRLNMSGENPYDAQKKEGILTAAGGIPSSNFQSAIMLNPPWALSIIMPFSALSYSLSRMIWLLLSISCLLLCAQQLWRFYNGNPHNWWVAWLVVILFAPTISVLEKGQITPLLLLGITGFLYFAVNQRNDWVAGVFLALATIKPQVFYIFWIAIIFWVIKRRRWAILVSCIVTTLSLTLVAMAFNPSILNQYMEVLKGSFIQELATPTIGAYLRFFWLGIDKFWLQSIPALLGALWFVYYWYKHNYSWFWVKELPILLLVSQVSAPYTYTYDQVILLPAILLAMIWLIQDKRWWSTSLYLSIFLAISILDLGLHMKLDDFWFVWMSPAWLIWFLLVRKKYPASNNYFSFSNPEVDQQ